MNTINLQQETKKITDWIEKTFSQTGMDNIIIGLSGGIDSSVSCALVVKAIAREHVIPVVLPYGLFSKESVEDARLVTKHLSIPEEQIIQIDIQPEVDTIADRKENHELRATSHTLDEIDQVRRGNIMARIRMIHLFDLAKQHNGLVCGTENKSEHYLGYFTRFGDEASDIEPIRHLYKTQVWEMGRYVGLPEKIITKAPTAGLWDGQTDEGELGFSYQDADKVLYYLIDEKLSEKEIIAKGMARELVRKVLARVKDNEFKRHLPLVYSKNLH